MSETLEAVAKSARVLLDIDMGEADRGRLAVGLLTAMLAAMKAPAAAIRLPIETPPAAPAEPKVLVVPGVNDANPSLTRDGQPRQRAPKTSHLLTADQINAAMEEAGTGHAAAELLGIHWNPFRKRCADLGISLPSRSDAAKAKWARKREATTPDGWRIGRKIKWTKDILQKALDDNEGDQRKAADSLKLPTPQFKAACKNRGIELANLPRPGGGDAWTKEARIELAKLWYERPIIPIEEIGERMGRTASAIQTAASRFNLQPRGLNGGGGVYRADLDKALQTPNGKMRPCMTCEKPFFSTGHGERICPKCKTGEGLAA